MPLSWCLFGHSGLMWRQGLLKQRRVGWIKKEKRGRRREVKGIYRQEPSISGNGYACLSVIPNCCSFFPAHQRLKKNKKGARLRGIDRIVDVSTPQAKNLICVARREVTVCRSAHRGGMRLGVKKVYNVSFLHIYHIPVKPQ